MSWIAVGRVSNRPFGSVPKPIELRLNDFAIRGSFKISRSQLYLGRLRYCEKCWRSEQIFPLLNFQRISANMKIQIKLQRGRERGKYNERKKRIPHGEYKSQKLIADKK